MIIRKTIICIITVAVMFTAFGIQQGYCADVAKIGIVNFQKIFETSAAGKAAKNKINQEGQRMNAELDKLHKDIKGLQTLIKKDSSSGVMSKAALDDKKWELDRKVNEVKALGKRFDVKIQKMQVRLINDVRKDVLKIIQEHGKKEGFLVILEEITVVYAPQSKDITDKIIQLYNAAYAKRGK